MHVAVAKREEELASAFEERFMLCKARLHASHCLSTMFKHVMLMLSVTANAGPAGKDPNTRAATGRCRDKAFQCHGVGARLAKCMAVRV